MDVYGQMELAKAGMLRLRARTESYLGMCVQVWLTSPGGDTFATMNVPSIWPGGGTCKNAWFDRAPETGMFWVYMSRAR
jgi:hypothetical protein